MTTDARAASSLAPTIEGLTLRTYRPGDATAISELANRVFEADDVPWRTDPAEQENWLSAGNEHFDPARDAFMVEVDGTLVANADTEWVDTTDGLREFRMGAMVDPGLAPTRDRDLAAAHARRRTSRGWRPPTRPTDRQSMLGSWAADTETERIALLAPASASSRRATSSTWCGPRWTRSRSRCCPTGSRSGRWARTQLRQLWDADIEAFRDHWGGFDGSEERFQQWMQRPEVRSRACSSWPGTATRSRAA